MSRIIKAVATATLALALSTSTLGAASAATPDKLNQTFSAGGTTSQYHIYGAGVENPKGILFYLDGDGQYGFKNPGSSYALAGSKGIVAEAKKRGYITVAVKTPDTQGTPTWWEDGTRNAAYFEAFRKHIQAQHPDAKQIWLAGYSGGAEFITAVFLPKYQSVISHEGGAVMLGGGISPWSNATFDKTKAAKFEMHWHTGAEDIAANSDEGYDALGHAKKGKAWYAGKGFPTSSAYPAGVDHNLSQQFGGIIAGAMDDNGASVVTPDAPESLAEPGPAPTPAPAPGTETDPVDKIDAPGRTEVTPAKPYFNAFANIVRIPSVKGVSYYINGAKKAPGVYWRAGTGVVTAKASSEAYTITGTASWKFDNRNAVKASSPWFSARANTVKIPKKDGISYYIDGAKKKAGTYHRTGKTVVTVKPASKRYKVDGAQRWAVKL